MCFKVFIKFCLQLIRKEVKDQIYKNYLTVYVLNSTLVI